MPLQRSIARPFASVRRPVGPDLTQCLVDVLTACCVLGTDDSVRLASHLSVSVHTTRSYFKRINKRLGTASRAEAILYALRRGWNAMEPPDMSLS
jgi:hypothetical protein